MIAYGIANRKTLKNLLRMYGEEIENKKGKRRDKSRRKPNSRAQKERIQLYMMVLILFLGAFILTQSMLNSFLVAAVGYIVLLKMKEISDDKKTEKLNMQLADALLIVSNSLRAGASLAQAWSSGAERIGTPLKKELIKIESAIRLGFPPEEALRIARPSIPSKEFDLVVTSTSILSRAGGDMAEVYENISSIIKERLTFRRAVASSTTYLRLTAAVTTALPLISLFWVRSTNPGYFDPLVTQYGNMVYVLYFAMVCIGWIIISKILYVELD